MTETAKTLLVWDIDDVLNRFMFLAFEDLLARKKMKYEELSVMPPCEKLGIGKPEYLAALDAARPGLYREGPRPEVMDFFERHGGDFEHVALSAAPVRFAPDSARWLLRHFGRWIQSCVFIPSPRPGVTVLSQRFRSKGEALAALGSRAVLIDDSPLNAADALEHGGRALLFPAPWNQNRGLPIADFLDGLVKLK